MEELMWVMLISGVVSGVINMSKGRSVGTGCLLGFLLGPIGFMLATILPTTQFIKATIVSPITYNILTIALLFLGIIIPLMIPKEVEELPLKSTVIIFITYIILKSILLFGLLVMTSDFSSGVFFLFMFIPSMVAFGCATFVSASPSPWRANRIIISGALLGMPFLGMIPIINSSYTYPWETVWLFFGGVAALIIDWPYIKWQRIILFILAESIWVLTLARPYPYVVLFIHSLFIALGYGLFPVKIEEKVEKTQALNTIDN